MHPRANWRDIIILCMLNFMVIYLKLLDICTNFVLVFDNAMFSMKQEISLKYGKDVKDFACQISCQ